MAVSDLNPQTTTRAALDVTGADRILRSAALLFGAGLLIHAADHFRRGLDVLTAQVYWAGNVSTVAALVAITLVFLKYRRAALIAVVAGFSQAIGVAAVHLPPEWGAFSDSLSDGHVDPFSWMAVLLEIVGAAAFGAAGVYALSRRERRGAAEHGAG